MNQCFGLQYTVFSHLSLASNMVQVIEGKNKYKRSQGKKNLLRVWGIFELFTCRVRVIEGKIAVNA